MTPPLFRYFRYLVFLLRDFTYVYDQVRITCNYMQDRRNARRKIECFNKDELRLRGKESWQRKIAISTLMASPNKNKLSLQRVNSMVI